MKITVKTVKGESYQIECEESWTICQIKGSISNLLAIEPEI